MTFSVSRHSRKSISIRTYKGRGDDGFGGFVKIMSGRQFLAVAEATVMQKPGNKEVKAVAATDRSTRTIERIRRSCKDQLCRSDQLKKDGKRDHVV